MSTGTTATAGDGAARDAPGLAATLGFWALAFALGMGLLSVERALLDVLYRPAGVDSVDHAFLEGLRFDAASVAYVLLPALVVAALLPHLRRGAVTLAFALLVLVCIVELHFFAEFHRRLDFVVFEYLDDPGTALGMAVQNVGALQLVAEVATAFVVLGALRRALGFAGDAARSGARGSWAGLTLALLALFLAARGGVGRPLRPQDVISGPHNFQRQLALSGPFTLARHAFEALGDGGGLPAYGAPDDPATLAAARAVFATPGETFHDDAVPAWRALPAHGTPWRNVVVVVLESFAARHVGTLGAAEAWSPELDRLAARGVLFTRFLANGPSTNRGLPALLAGVPSFPTRTALTKSMEGQQPFLSLGHLRRAAGAETVFLTAGAASWENLGGWCRGQGFDAVVDGSDFDADDALSVWGVPDEVLLARTLAECDARAARGAFCAVALTSSNHPPFAVPEAFGDAGADPRERAFRYADHALGAFLDEALTRDWARDTLFVLLGDHGLDERSRAAIDPERYHVPLLLLDGAAAPHAPLLPRRIDDIASQVDVLPTVLALLGGGVDHAAWGHDLLGPPPAARIAVLGPNGGAPEFGAVDDTGRLVAVPLGGGAPRAFTWGPGRDDLPRAERDAATDALAAAARAYLATAHRAVLSRHAAPPGTD